MDFKSIGAKSAVALLCLINFASDFDWRLHMRANEYECLLWQHFFQQAWQGMSKYTLPWWRWESAEDRHFWSQFERVSGAALRQLRVEWKCSLVVPGLRGDLHLGEQQHPQWLNDSTYAQCHVTVWILMHFYIALYFLFENRAFWTNELHATNYSMKAQVCRCT